MIKLENTKYKLCYDETKPIDFFNLPSDVVEDLDTIKSIKKIGFNMRVEIITMKFVFLVLKMMNVGLAILK